MEINQLNINEYPLLVSAANDETIRVWNKTLLVKIFKENVMVMAYSKKDFFFATGSNKGEIKSDINQFL